MTYVRMSTVQADPSQLEEGIRLAREQVLPLMRQLPGFEGMRFLVDRASGKAMTVSLWESEAAARSADSGLSQVRTQITQQLGLASPTLEIFEMVINESA